MSVDNIAELITLFIFPSSDPVVAAAMPNLREKFPGLADAIDVLKESLVVEVDREIFEFVRHARKYLHMYHPNAGFEIDRTYRYKTDKVESRLLATKEFLPGTELKHLTGVIASLTPEEEIQLENRDFSVMFSVYRKCMCLFTGPARFINHDCDPNCKVSISFNKFISLSSGEITVQARKQINIGDEITCYYSSTYFGDNNIDCLCESCEL